MVGHLAWHFPLVDHPLVDHLGYHPLVVEQTSTAVLVVELLNFFPAHLDFSSLVALILPCSYSKVVHLKEVLKLEQQLIAFDLEVLAVVGLCSSLVEV